jgi:4-amino-4-deoxy-L-arabinose transferase-like glycosyltransferase
MSGRTDTRTLLHKRALDGARQLLAELLAALRHVPRAAWACALVASLNAACWSIVSPPFEVPDEPSHFAYVQHLAETGHLPSGNGETFPHAERAVLNDLLYSNVRFDPSVDTISSPSEQRRLERTLAAPLSRTDSAQAGVATAQPPLYYALETVPYKLGSPGTLLDQLALMRLLSALMGGLTALFAFLFLREALPGAPWAWTVGGLGVALAPLLGLMSGAVNPDALLFAVSAALFYCLARGFRRGLTPGLAVALGAVLAVGVLTKLTFLSLVPGTVLGLLALCLREARTSPRAAYRSFGLAAGIGASPVVLYALYNTLAGKPVLGALAGALNLSGKSGSLLKELGYIWQFYLPPLPGMHDYFHGFLTTRVLWFNGLLGLYGWLDTTFPSWVYTAALVPAALIAALFARALYTYRGALRSRLVELCVYLAIVLGVAGVIGVDDYIHHLPTEYAEPRYLLPLLALWGPILALAARGAGRRWGPVVGVLLVTLLLAHDVFSQLLVISRYYG